MQNNATFSMSNLLSLLSRYSPILTNNPRLIPEFLTATFLMVSTKELLKLFMQTYMDTVKSQVQVLVPLDLVEPKKQFLKARFPELCFG